MRFPVVRLPPTIIFAPSQLMSRMQVYTVALMIGPFQAMIFSADTNMLYIFSQALWNLLFS